MNSDILDTAQIKNSKIFLKEHHQERTYEAFQFLKLSVSRHDINRCYVEIENKYAAEDNRMLRIVFSRKLPLSFDVQVLALEELRQPMRLSPVPTVEFPKGSSRFKWEDRSLWTEMLKHKRNKADDFLLLNESGLLVETSRFNLFCFDPMKDIVLTPELSSGCLNGVYRRHVLDLGSISLPEFKEKKIIEQNVRIVDIGNYRLFVAKSVREVLTAAFMPG